MFESKAVDFYRMQCQQGKETNYYEFKPENRGAFENIEGWEFRFAINPSQENIKKAIEAALPILLPEGLPENDEPSFKFFLFNDPTIATPQDAGYEGPYVNFSIRSNTDRDQRSKESVFYLRKRKDNHQFEKTPEELRELILKLWKAFIDHGVDIGYISPQIGDKSLPSDPGLVTPVSYSYVRPIQGGGVRDWPAITQPFWQQIQQMNLPLMGDQPVTDLLPDATESLYAQRAALELKGSVDPLAGVQITYEDLDRHRIPVNKVVEMQVDKISYLRAHYTKAVADITADLKKQTSIKTTVDSVKESFRYLEALVVESNESKEDRVVDEKNLATDAGWHLLCDSEKVFQSLQEIINERSDGLVDVEKLKEMEKKETADLGGIFSQYTSKLIEKNGLLHEFGKEAFLRKFAQRRTDVENIIRFFPRKDVAGGLESPVIIKSLNEILSRSVNICAGNLVQGFKQAYLPEAQKYFNKILEEAKGQAPFAREREEIYAEFYKDANILGFLNEIGIGSEKLKDMIANDPGAMQLFYRRLRELKKEKYFLYQEQHRLQQMIQAYSKEGNFSNLRTKIFLPTFLVLVVATPLSSAIAIYGFGKLPENLTHNLVEGDSLADHFKTFGLNAVEGLLLTALIGFIIYKSVRYSYDKQLIEAVEQQQSDEVAALIAKGADPQQAVPGTPAQTLLQKAVATKDKDTVDALLKNPSDSKWFSGAFFGPSEVKSVVKDDAEFSVTSPLLIGNSRSEGN